MAGSLFVVERTGNFDAMIRRAKLWSVLALGAFSALAPSVAYADESSPAAAAPDDAQMAEARKAFQAGVNLLDDPDGAKYDEAYLAFKKAHELSKSSKVLGNLGFCAFHLERDGEALDAYAAYLREVPDIDERERQQITRDMTTLSTTVARFKATAATPLPNTVLIDSRAPSRGNAVINQYPLDGKDVTIRIRPGRHTFRIRSGERESLPFETIIEPASNTSHEFTFPVQKGPTVVEVPVEMRPRSSPVGPIIVGALGLAALGAGTVTGVLARNKTDDIESTCPGDLCPHDYDLTSNRDSARTLATVADASFIGGGVLVAGAVVWYLVQPKGGTTTKPRMGNTPATHSRLLPSVGCQGNGCGVGLGGSF